MIRTGVHRCAAPDQFPESPAAVRPNRCRCALGCVSPLIADVGVCADCPLLFGLLVHLVLGDSPLSGSGRPLTGRNLFADVR